MDRRTFLTAVLGAVGTTALVGFARPKVATAGTIHPSEGILHELNASTVDDPGDGPGATVDKIQYRHRGPGRGRRRRPVWRTVCRRYRHRGRWHRRCRRERVWIYY